MKVWVVLFSEFDTGEKVTLGMYRKKTTANNAMQCWAENIMEASDPGCDEARDEMIAHLLEDCLEVVPSTLSAERRRERQRIEELNNG